MDIATLCIASLFPLLFFIFNTLWKKKKTSIGRNVPQPSGSWPVIGHLPMLSDPAIPHLVFGALADKYGPIFMVKLGFHKAIVVSSAAIAKECFTVNDRSFETRPRSVAVKTMGYNYGLFGFGPSGSYWREARKIATLELLSNHMLELLKDVRRSEVGMSIAELHQIYQAKSGNSCKPVLVEMKEWFGAFTINVIVRMVAGKRYLNVGASKSDNQSEGERLQKAVNDFFYLTGVFVVADAIPWLGWIDIKGHVKAMKKTAKDVDNILSTWLEEHRRNKSADDTKTGKDFMYVMLSVLGDKKLSQYEPDVVNKALCWGMILGGVDATTVTLTWALSLLLNNRESLKKAQDEIDKEIGKDRQVEECDIEKLVYLQAIIKETWRLYPPAPMSAQHEAAEDCTIAGYHVPAGTRLLTNLSKIHRDPSIWSNPNEFQPDRFLTTQANVDVRGQHFELMPFGSGRRSCPGISFALQVVKLALARLLQGFDFETPTEEPVDMTESAGLTNLKATPLEVLITPRLHQNLY